jgi:hypothetical protein
MFHTQHSQKNIRIQGNYWKLFCLLVPNGNQRCTRKVGQWKSFCMTMIQFGVVWELKMITIFYDSTIFFIHDNFKNKASDIPRSRDHVFCPCRYSFLEIFDRTCGPVFSGPRGLFLWSVGGEILSTTSATHAINASASRRNPLLISL